MGVRCTACNGEMQRRMGWRFPAYVIVLAWLLALWCAALIVFSWWGTIEAASNMADASGLDEPRLSDTIAKATFGVAAMIWNTAATTVGLFGIVLGATVGSHRRVWRCKSCHHWINRA